METIKINIETNAQDAAKTFEDLSKSFNDTDRSSQDLRKQIKGLKDELYALTPGTEEYANVLQELGGKMDQLKDTQEELRVATGGLDQVFQATTNATATMASGFTAVSGVMALFGGESEDLQKTFVKLQAVMAIMNGLKGFAGFGKETKKASISLKAYINQTLIATKATQQQVSATGKLAATETLASRSTNLLSNGFKKLTTAIISNPIGALLTVVTSLVTVFTLLGDKINKTTSYLQIFGDEQREGLSTTRTYSEQLDIQNQKMEDYYNMLKTIGVSEEDIHQQRIDDKKKELEDLEKQKAKLEEVKKKAEEYGTWESKLITWFFPSLNPKLEDASKNIEEIDGLIKDINNDIKVLENKPMLPESWSNLNLQLKELGNTFKVQIAGGLADQGDYIKAQIKVYQDAKNELWKTVGAGHHAHSVIKGATENERAENKKLSTLYAANIASLQVELDAYNAGIDNKNRDAAKKLADQLKNNFNDLIKDVTNEAKKIKEKWNSVLSSLDLESFTIFPKEERSGRMSAQVLRFTNDIDSYLDTWHKLAQKAYDEGKISKTQFDSFISSINGIKEDLVKGLDVKFDSNAISEPVRQFGENLQKSINELKLDNEKMKEALSTGLISEEEYRSWIALKFKEYQEITAQEIETSNPIEQAFITASKQILPPEVKTQIENDVKAYYDEIVKQLDKEYKEIEAEIDSLFKIGDKFNDIYRSWLDGGASYWGTAPSAIKNVIKETQELNDQLHNQAVEEMNALEAKMAVLDKSSEAHEQYNAKLQELRKADEEAQKEYNERTLALQNQHKDSILAMSQSFTDKIGGLAGALGDYYAEQAEQAKESYGENSEEYKKYLKKEGQMKIAQVWTNFASGVMATWATSEAFGPIAGPILAAIQTAALLATAVASTQMISRQSKAASSGGGESSVANVAGMTDRVIMADAQNTDQTARLNADYNSGNQKIYVAATDISDKQDENRVAVSNNGF